MVKTTFTRAGRLSEDERRRMLRSIDAVSTQQPTRTVAAVERELRDRPVRVTVDVELEGFTGYSRPGFASDGV